MNNEEALKDFAAGIMNRCQEAITEAQNTLGDDVADEVCEGYVTISAWCEDVIDGRSLQAIVQSEM